MCSKSGSLVCNAKFGAAAILPAPPEVSRLDAFVHWGGSLPSSSIHHLGMLFLLSAISLGIALLLIRHYLPHLRTLLGTRRPASPAPPTSSSPESEKERVWGTWSRVHLWYPTVTPWSDFDVDATRPIPFRPFRWGPSYPINMGIRPMPWNDWIQLDSE